VKTFRLLLILVYSLCLLNSCGGGGNMNVLTTTPLTIISGAPPDGTVASVYDGSGFSVSASGGRQPYMWSWAAAAGSSVPPGLSFSNASITGTPTTAGPFNVIVTVSDSESPAVHVSANYTIIVAAPLQISSGAPPSGTFGMTYGPSSSENLKCFWNPYRGWHLVCNPCSSPSACASLPPCNGNIAQSPCRETKQVFLGFPLAATGGLPPYTWALTKSSSLPPGLNLTTSGMIAGTPATPGTSNITVTVSDSASPATQASAPYKIVIAPPPPPVINAVALLPIGTLGSPYVGFTFTATSKAPSLTWNNTGALPQGMTLGQDGALSGKPSEARTFPITVMVQDSFGQDATPVRITLQVLTQGFLPTGSMETSRASHSATLLNTGKVLIAGGSPMGYIQVVATAELFDPLSGSFSSTGSMGTARVSHTATLLADGRVLVTGGRDINDNPVLTAEIFDPVNGTFSPTGNMETTRLYNTATLLKTGIVLVAGGLDAAGTFLATAELFDPRTGLFTPTGNMVTPRAGHTSTSLSDGRVLVAGGDTTTAEIFDPATGTFTPTASLEAARVNHTATLLKNGKVLVTGGQDNGSNTLASAELFDPAVGTFTPTASMETVRVNHTAVLLDDGTVLVAGGNDSSTGFYFSSAELFDPASGRFTPTADMTAARSWHTATFLNNGKVLVTGGQNGQATLASAELYQ
jgi:hypothetical protein